MRSIIFALFLVLAATTVFAAPDKCRLDPQSRTFDAFLEELPELNAKLADCPVHITGTYGLIPKNGHLYMEVGDKHVLATIENTRLTRLSQDQATCSRKIVLSKDDADAVLGATDRGAALKWLFTNKRVKVQGCTLWSRIGLWVAQPVGRSALARTIPTPPQQTAPQAQQGQLLCDFYNAPTKQVVTCGAPMAADNFCKLTMGSAAAKSIACDEDGQVLCTVPCSVYSAVKVTNRCAFDLNRARGTQAPPIGSCPAVQAPQYGPGEPGDLCKHGGECRTGNCVGVGQGPPWTYRCSCDPFRYTQMGC